MGCQDDVAGQCQALQAIMPYLPQFMPVSSLGPTARALEALAHGALPEHSPASDKPLEVAICCMEACRAVAAMAKVRSRV